ncbi:MAG: helix-turn-helix domain-containing protein [Candidatus Nanoarchaeia archaeon]|jgi:sugar-specific transcriptional regulator TrmB
MVVMMDFLRKLGLNKYECLSYLALLKEGAMSAYNISSKSQVPFGRIYDSLKILENKGLIEVIPGKPKKYLSRNPKNSISTLLDEKANDVESLRKEINSFSELFKKSTKSDYEITLLNGKHNFAKCLAEHFDYKKEFYATSEAFKLEKWFPSIQRYATQQPSRRFVLLDKNKADAKRIKELKDFGINLRHYPLENVRFLVSDEELVTISIQENNDFTTIHARNKSLGKAMTKIINDIWDKAEKL